MTARGATAARYARVVRRGVLPMACGGALLGAVGAGRAQVPLAPLLDPLRAAHWRVPGEGWGQPAADASTAYFLGRRHEVVAVHARSGAVAWRTVTGEPGERTIGKRVVAAGSVVAAGDTNVTAFDARTGARRWRFEPRDAGYAPGEYLGPAANGAIYTGARGGRLYAVDHETGAPRWSVAAADGGEGDTSAGDSAAAGSIVFDPVVHGHDVAALYTVFTTPTTGGVVVVDARTGRRRWRVPFPRGDGATPSHAGSGLALTEALVVASSGDGSIHGLERSTGEPLWRIPPLDALARRGAGTDSRPLAVVGRTLVAGSLTGRVTAYDLPSRRVRWEHQGRGSVAFDLTIDEDTVYVPYVNGRLVALAVGTGSVRWEIGDVSSSFAWLPTGFGRRLYLAGTNAGFLAIPR